jgi:hypothetical protein
VNSAAVVSTKHAAIDRKLAKNWQFWKLTFAAVTLIAAVLAVSSVNLGRLVPLPRPTTATPAMLMVSAVALEMVSAWPGLTMMMSPRLATHWATAPARVENGLLKVPLFWSEPPRWPLRRRGAVVDPEHFARVRLDDRHAAQGDPVEEAGGEVGTNGHLYVSCEPEGSEIGKVTVLLKYQGGGEGEPPPRTYLSAGRPVPAAPVGLADRVALVCLVLEVIGVEVAVLLELRLGALEQLEGVRALVRMKKASVSVR